MNKFDIGKVVMTRGVSDKMADDTGFAQFVSKSLNRYLDCDWGEMDAEDKKMNDSAVVNNDDRIFASYKDQENGWTVWFITEWDRSATTILFPDEY